MAFDQMLVTVYPVDQQVPFEPGVLRNRRRRRTPRSGSDAANCKSWIDHGRLRTANDAPDEPGAPRGTVGALDTNSGDIIDRNGDEQDQNVDGDECHVEDAAGDEQHRRSITRGEEKYSTYNQWKEDRKLQGVKQHAKRGIV